MLLKCCLEFNTLATSIHKIPWTATKKNLTWDGFPLSMGSTWGKSEQHIQGNPITFQCLEVHCTFMHHMFGDPVNHLLCLLSSIHSHCNLYLSPTGGHHWSRPRPGFQHRFTSFAWGNLYAQMVEMGGHFLRTMSCYLFSGTCNSHIDINEEVIGYLLHGSVKLENPGFPGVVYWVPWKV